MSELNLIPYELKVRRVKKIKITNYISAGVIVFAVLFAIVYVPKLYLARLISEQQDMDTKIAGDSKIVQENKRILADMAKYNSYNNEVTLLTKQKVNVKDKIKSLEKYIPSDVSLTNIAYSKGMITINGSTAKYASISAFAANLQMSAEYSKARINSINNSDSKTKTGNYIFTINIAQ
jgi:Tfp pilus assembly protein PilN